MKRPNRHLEKKYISSLVIAAFLALSVLTANNLRMDNSGAKKTEEESKETISPSDFDPGQEDPYESESEDEQEQDPSPAAGENRQSDNEPLEDAKEDEREDEQKVKKNNDSGNEKSDDKENSESWSYDGKSKLTWPVLGNVILPYSMDTTVYYSTLDQFACNDGILIAAKKGDPVRASADGRIVDIQKTDRYGTVVTLKIGKYYKLYYGQMQDLSYEIGDDIREGEVLGTVAEPTRSFLLEGPHLFFKMSYKEKTVNPAEYLK